MRARPDEVRPGFRARHEHTSRPGRKGGGDFHSEKLPSRGRGKPQCGLSVTMPPEGRPLCPALLGHEQRLICQAYAYWRLPRSQKGGAMRAGNFKPMAVPYQGLWPSKRPTEVSRLKRRRRPTSEAYRGVHLLEYSRLGYRVKTLPVIIRE